MKKLIIPMMMAFAALTACEKSNEKVAEQVAEKAYKEKTATDDHSATGDHASETAGLELDNGKKWKTNAEMLPYIQEQEKLIEAYDKEKGEFKTLASNLSTANQKLIKSCTMTGKSHDVLHVWLMDHMKKIELLAKTDNKTEADRLAEELEHSMVTYHQYFE
jgi:hypothetical protein